MYVEATGRTRRGAVKFHSAACRRSSARFYPKNCAGVSPVNDEPFRVRGVHMHAVLVHPKLVPAPICIEGHRLQVICAPRSHCGISRSSSYNAAANKRRRSSDSSAGLRRVGQASASAGKEASEQASEQASEHVGEPHILRGSRLHVHARESTACPIHNMPHPIETQANVFVAGPGSLPARLLPQLRLQSHATSWRRTRQQQRRLSSMLAYTLHRVRYTSACTPKVCGSVDVAGGSRPLAAHFPPHGWTSISVSVRTRLKRESTNRRNVTHALQHMERR